MLQRHSYDGFTWIDCDNPTLEEIRTLIDEFNIEPIIANDLASPSIRPRVEPYANHLYLILHFPTLDSAQKDTEVDFIIGKDFLITTHYQNIDPVYEFAKIFEVDAILDRPNITKNGGFVFYYMIRALYHSLSEQLESLNDTLLQIEENIFNGHERKMVFEISLVNRKLLRFRSSLQHHLSVLSSFEEASSHMFGKDYSYYARSILGEYSKVAASLTHLHAYLDELRSTNDSLLTTKQNETVKNLTIMAFLALPATVVASIFGMNTKFTPIVGHPNDFWLIVIIMAIVATLTFGFFKHKRWI